MAHTDGPITISGTKMGDRFSGGKHGRTNACNGTGGRVGFEINAYFAGPLMRDVILQEQSSA